MTDLPGLFHELTSCYALLKFPVFHWTKIGQFLCFKHHEFATSPVVSIPIIYVNHNLYHYIIISIFLDIIWQPDATLENSEVPQFPFEKNHGFSPWTLAFHMKHLDLPQEMARKVALVPMPQAFCDRMNPMIRLRWVGGAPPPKKTRPFAGDKARKNPFFGVTYYDLLIFRGYFPAGIESIDAALQLFDMCRPVTWHQLAGLGKCF